MKQISTFRFIKDLETIEGKPQSTGEDYIDKVINEFFKEYKEEVDLPDMIVTETVLDKKLITTIMIVYDISEFVGTLDDDDIPLD